VRGYVIQHFMFLLFLDRGIGREARQVVDGVEEVGISYAYGFSICYKKIHLVG
jgi:hypothetical protein